MSGGYDDRDGKIWLDGKFIDWRDANVHVLTHAMHYASSVFEGERAYNGKIFKSLEHSERFKKSAKLIDFEIPYSVEEIEKSVTLFKRDKNSDENSVYSYIVLDEPDKEFVINFPASIFF